MKTNIFFNSLSSAKLNENFSKHFGSKVNLEKFSREELEDMRNKIRTRVFQHEGSAGYNDLLTNETYQKDKAVLQLLNTRIKEMLGENIKQLRDKMVELSEAKAKKDYDGDGKIESPKDEVWGSRAKAAKKAGKGFKEETDVKETSARRVKGKGYDNPEKDATPLKGEVPDNPWHDARSAKFSARQAKGKLVKGRAQSAKQPDDDLDESEKPSAGMTKKEKSAVVKKARAGKDIGKPGKGFEKVEKAAKKGGAKDPKAVAAAAMWKQQAKESFKRNVKVVNESLERMIAEDEEGKAKAITAASDIVNDFTSWMQRVGQYQSKAIIELADAIRADFGLQQSETFKSSVAPALASTLEILTQQREVISNAVAVLAGEDVPPEEQMGMEPGASAELPPEPGMEPTAPDELNPEVGGDEFAASDAAAGGPEASGRELRESSFAQRLAESHNLMASLSR